MKVDGAQILAKALKYAGVEKIFTLTGGHIYRVYQECEKVGIEIVDTRHESAAGYAAIAYAHLSGKPGVILATAGPGVTNLMTPVIDAKLLGVPLLVLGGAALLSGLLTGQVQEYDTLTLMRCNTVWAEKCIDTKRIAEYVAIAYRFCMGSVLGPAYIELPLCVLQTNLVEEKEVKYPTGYKANAQMLGEYSFIEKAAELLVNAERPAILIGDGAQFDCKSPQTIKELVEYLQIPVNTSRTTKGLFFNEDKPLYRVGTLASVKADVLLTLNIEADAAENVPKMNPRARLIGIHRNSQVIGMNRGVEIGIAGNADAVAKQILDCVKSKTEKRNSSNWVESLEEKRQQIFQRYVSAFTSDESPIHPARLAYEVQKFLNADGKEYNLIVDGGDCLMWGLMASTFIMDDTGAHVGRLYHGTRLGAIGYAAGAVTGAWTATGRPMVYATGDGSLGQYVGEFFTYAKKNIPVICIISNDSNYGMIKACANIFTPAGNNDLGCVLNCEDGGIFKYEKLAEVWGGFGELVTDPDNILPALKRAKDSGKPAIINVQVMCNQKAFSPGTISLYSSVGFPPVK